MSDRESEVRARFESDIDAHSMHVIRDDGLYRHLRFRRDDSWTYGFDLVTWPGYLAIVGDAGDFVFSRTTDMFEWFGSDGERINPGYWSEKLQAPLPRDVMEFSPDRFRRMVFEWFARQVRDEGMSRGDIAVLKPRVRELMRTSHGFDHEALEALRDWQIPDWDEPDYKGPRTIDAWEWGESLRDYNFHFLWCCHAIVWGIQQYRAIVRRWGTRCHYCRWWLIVRPARRVTGPNRGMLDWSVSCPNPACKRIQVIDDYASEAPPRR